VLAVVEVLEHGVDIGGAAVVVVGLERCFDAEMAEESAGMAGVFGVADIDFSEDTQRTGTDVFEVPDRCGNDVERHGKWGQKDGRAKVAFGAHAGASRGAGA